MPLPSPRGNESRRDFVSRCMSNEQVKEDFGSGTDQALGVCNSRWEEAKTASETDKIQGETMKFNIFEQFREFLDKEEGETVSESPTDTASSSDKAEETVKNDENLEKLREIAKNEGVSPRGGENPRVAFIGASPSKVDVIRGKVFAGSINNTLQDHYLNHLDVEKDEVVFMNLVPTFMKEDHGIRIGNPREPTIEEIEEWAPFIKEQLQELAPQVLVALGTTARNGLEKIFDRQFDESIDEFVPHPRAIAMHGDSGEIERKFKRLNKTLDLIENATITKEDQPAFRVTKLNEELQVVKGIVLEPGVEDTDGNWTTRSEIEKAAHNFLTSGNTKVKRNHMEQMDDAHIVESHIQEQDTEVNGETVKAGSWVVGIKIEDPEEWKLVKSGRYGGFSIGAKARIDPSLRLQ